MWSKWKERFQTFGAARIELLTSTRGGSKAGKTITGAKCLIFFESDYPTAIDNPERKIDLQKLVDKTLCTERTEVTLLDEEDFGYQVKD